MTAQTDDILWDGPEQGPLLILAHGAGAPMDSDPMTALAAALSDAGFRVARFEFGYMQRRREDGRKRPPEARTRLLARWREVVEQIQSQHPRRPLWIGGKSMGGRVATEWVAEEAPDGVAGCLCFGYPFHPPGKPDRWRIGHFPTLPVPLWIAQGEKDPFGRRDEVTAQSSQLGSARIHWVPEANHDLKPNKRSGVTPEAAYQALATEAYRFVESGTGNSDRG